jgi:hypothetical protein
MICPRPFMPEHYKCSRLVRFGKEACCLLRTRTCHRAERVEALVWDTVSTLLCETPNGSAPGLRR